MATRIRTLDFLPEIFKTPTNNQFLSATLDKIVDQPNTMKIEGYIGSKFGYGVNPNDYYVVELNKTRRDYQLEPGVIFTKPDQSTAQDFISYPGIIDALKLYGAKTNDNNRLFTSQFYSWDSFTNLDKIINFNEYYWLPNGPPAVTVSTSIVFDQENYNVTNNKFGYQFSDVVGNNPTITLLRGGTYTFEVDQNSQFWIQGEPGTTGLATVQTNVNTREILGVSNNGASNGTVTFVVPNKTAQDQFELPGNNTVDLISTIPFSQLNGALLSTIKNIDGITSLNGLSVMFYGTGDLNTTTYIITYTGSPSNPTLTLVPGSPVFILQKYTVQYGTQYIGKSFYKEPAGELILIPYISANKDILYYQDGTSSNKFGVIKIIDNNDENYINVETEILGKTNYSAPNGVVFTNGLKVIFENNIIPSSYLNNEYYVEGVGSAIQLIPVEQLVVPEGYASSVFIPFDSLPYDIGNFDNDLYVPVQPDYITIARNSLDRNSWSRSNRWFHVDVINNTSIYNNDPSVLDLANLENKAKRPIIEFYPNLKLFNTGTEGKNLIDFFDTKTPDAFNQVSGQQVYYPDVETYTTFPGTATIAGVVGTSTTITVPEADVVGTFDVGQYIADSAQVLPTNSEITNVSISSGIVTLTVQWANTETIAATSSVTLVANEFQLNAYQLFDGARIVFSEDENVDVRNKIYVCSIVDIGGIDTIVLSEASDGEVLINQQVVALRGFYNEGKTFYYYDDVDNNINLAYVQAQEKTTVNQAPLFDVLDNNGISFGNKVYYQGSSFEGSKLFAYQIGEGENDPILGFPLKFNNVNNLGDINFDVSLNTDTFDYVSQSNPITQKVNTGYVYNYETRIDFTRQIGWQTAVSPSTQYQLFEFKITPTMETNSYEFKCDVVPVDVTSTDWPVLQVYFNNVLQEESAYTVTINNNETIITFTINDAIIVPEEQVSIEILILSNQVSKTAFYTVPINLSNNPFNEDIRFATVSDIRKHYQSIFDNNPNSQGEVFGANNYRDLGDTVQYGNGVIQNSASLVLPSVFLRKQNYSLFDALQYNSRSYVNFKNLLIDTVTKTDYSVYQTPAFMLDDALEQITANKTEEGSFFWSDMLPSKAPFVSNSYSFATSEPNPTIYPLSKIYDFTKANYEGVLVYINRVVNGLLISNQLIKNQDYTISIDSPSLTINVPLQAGDIVVISEYNQTYGTFVPNTPTKLGLYPASIPSVVLDTNYLQPTYFIKGHDGSFTKLYGNYDSVNNRLEDFRDQVLLEFEKRIYNNLKLSGNIPIAETDIIPGFFRDTPYSYNEILDIYSFGFLNWVGQNRIDYKTQLFNKFDEFTFNYYQSGNKIDKSVIEPGNWRGIYQYFYDTSTPESTPWEMLGLPNKPTWWEGRYGPAPYTKDNLILWQDLALGYNYNNGDPVIVTQSVRPELLDVIPVDSAGNLVPPLVSVVGNYNSNLFQRDWKVGDAGPAEFSYRRSSTYPFDLMRIFALTQPAKFFNLCVDLDNYKYSEEFNQYLVNERSHLIIDNIEIYGFGIPKTSYINWIVDYEKQFGINATTTIEELLYNLDVRLVYRLAGFSDKTLLDFFVERGTPGSKNSSLLIPDESYNVLLYENQPFTQIAYSGIVVQITDKGYQVYGNSQTTSYFKINKPVINNNTTTITVENLTVKVAKDYSDTEVIVPYSTLFLSVQELSQFLMSYGNYLEKQGMIFEQLENGLTINWEQMVAEFLYWAQLGWEAGSITTINPAATLLAINKDGYIVQPLTLAQQNFVLNQNLYPIQSSELSVVRENTLFTVKPLASGDSITFGQFNISNIEHGVVFDNFTLFNDTIYKLVTGLKQDRIYVRGTKTAEWNGTLDTYGFILNQDNIPEWNSEVKYTKGSIVKYKNKFYVALTLVQAKEVFDERDWIVTEYDEIQKGLLPNSSTRSLESLFYYDINKANLEIDADLLAFSLIGFRPREYMSTSDLTDITQVNVYRNFIKTKGTKNSVDAFKGATLGQGGINYEVYENWAIKSSEFGGVLNNNFIEFKLSEEKLTGNPSTVALIDGTENVPAQQQVPIYSLFNYSKPLQNAEVLSVINSNTPSTLLPEAGYVNFNDVKLFSYYYGTLANGINKDGTRIPLSQFYVRDYVWLANYLGTWQVYTPKSLGRVINAKNNLNNTVTITFDQPHNLTKFQIFAIVNFDNAIDGYHVVSTIVNPYRVIINLTLSPAVRDITANGTALKFQTQRVATPKDINTLPLLDSEFTKNTVWVDTNVDGSWAVFRKSINYQYETQNSGLGQQFYGSAVAYSDNLKYLAGDSDIGRVYRYNVNPSSGAITNLQTIVEGTSFGSAIVYSDDIVVISEPLNNPNVHIYQLQDNTLGNQLNVFQTAIAAPMGVTNWGSALAISGDKNFIYISDIDNNSVHVYRLSQSTGFYEPVYIIDGDALGLTVSGDNFGYSISTDYYSDTVVISAPDQEFDINTDNWGYTYIFKRPIQNIIVGNTSIPSVPQTFTMAFTPVGDAYVYVNGTLLDLTDFSIVSDVLTISIDLNAGDIITVSITDYVLAQTLTTEDTPKTGVRFGESTDTNTYSTEILVGAPFDLSNPNNEGAVYRFTNFGNKYGIITGTTECNVTTNRTIFLNGYSVVIPAGNAASAAGAIISANIPNITATSSNNILQIQLINFSIANTNEKLTINVLNSSTLSELGFDVYGKTQVIYNPHPQGAAQFGKKVKFNEFSSFVTSAIRGSRYSATTFDFVDDENFDNDTIFDNNTTQWVDEYSNAGAVYMFDYLPIYNENQNNVGEFIYAQSTNSLNQVYGSQPNYGYSLDFNNNHVVVGSPNFSFNGLNGQVVSYVNLVGEQDWSIYRSSSAVVDISKIQTAQLFSAETNNTLENLDYIDPLQGKLLGAVRENLDIISNIDPAGYSRECRADSNQRPLAWGSEHVGELWFDTSNVRFVNYHQNDNTYNSEYWGKIFPGSNVAVYSWVSSSVLPIEYLGPGTPYNIDKYSIEYTTDSAGNLIPVYFYWVRNTNVIFTKRGKTLADSIIESYILSPQQSGISYFAPLLPSMFAFYNCSAYINANDTVFHVGYSNGNNDEIGHSQYNLIRANFADDFLPGLPSIQTQNYPTGLYDKMLDSFSGVDDVGNIIPDPFLPKAVQSGIVNRQSFFYNRFNALKNYISYVNSILLQYPIVELRYSSFLFTEGLLNPSQTPPQPFYDTTNYWNYVNWWKEGYNNNTKPAFQVPLYSDLLTLTVPVGTIGRVISNGDGKAEIYIYKEDNTWERIGLENGTIEFSSSLYDYEAAKLGFGDNFFDTTPFDEYPSEETKYIIRAINEQLLIGDLLLFRNKALILLFEYTQSETIESQNYLPWLNKTSLIDVEHVIRELRPLESFRVDNTELLSGYINEVKPYHVVIKDFLFKYTGEDVYFGTLTDFDLPAQYNFSVDQFVTPQLVYQNISNYNQFLPTSNIWTENSYSEWFNNRGLSLEGEENFPITVLASYVVLDSTELAVDNASGFPINGTIKIGEELIGYTEVDTNLNILGGLIRGVNGTTITEHIPGDQIYIDLPAVILLDGGRDYQFPPTITAYIDTSVYPEPIEPAVLEPIMVDGTVYGINVVNPGKGYTVTPTIEIESSIVITFPSSRVNTSINTIELFSPSITTGDLIQYKVGANTTKIGGLIDGQWYYVRVLETVPSFLIGLYSTYRDAIRNENRISFFSSGTGSNHTLNVGARATCLTCAEPVRENRITLRFDRTSYRSRIIDWVPGLYYGSYYSGEFFNTERVASSSLKLSSVNPDINSILASAAGAVFEIVDVNNEQILDWSSLLRNVGSTEAGNIIRLVPFSSTAPYASGSTVGFYEEMPVKFAGAVGGTNLVQETIYYVKDIIDDTDFTISDTPGGAVKVLNAETISLIGLNCYTSEITNTAVLTIDYPGIADVTSSQSQTNILTLPLNLTGTGGTRGFYTGLPVFFTKKANNSQYTSIILNEVYYVTSVIDNQRFTISSEKTPITKTISEVSASSDILTCNNVTSLSVNDPIVFSDFTYNVGSLEIGQEYVISSLGSGTDLTDFIALGANSNTVGVVFTATGTGVETAGSFTIGKSYTILTLGSTNWTAIGASLSPVVGETFIATGVGSGTGTAIQGAGTATSTAFYPSFGGIVAGTVYYIRSINNITSEITISSSFNGPVFNITSDVVGTVLLTNQKDTITMADDVGNITINVSLPISPGQINGQEFTLYTSSPQQYQITSAEFANVQLLEKEFAYTKATGNIITFFGNVDIDNVYVNMPLTVSNNIGGLTSATPYFVIEKDNIIVDVTDTTGVGNTIVCTDNTQMYVDMPITFTGNSFGGISVNTQYFVASLSGITDFTIAEAAGGPEVLLSTTASGNLVGTGGEYIVVSTSLGGSPVALSDATNSSNITINQDPTIYPAPEFYVSYLLGGYRVVVSEPGEGWAVDNEILIDGSDLGGNTPANNLTLVVKEIDEFGRILSVYRPGDPADIEDSYYLKVISDNELKVYSNPTMTVPVSGISFPFNGIETTSATVTDDTLDTITVGDSSIFNNDDAVVFTGYIGTDFGGINVGQIYYVTVIDPTTISISEIPGGTPFDITTASTGNYSVTKAGSFAFLQEPFYFDQSLVRYNNRVYLCIVSNNDNEFVLGKWELLNSDDRRLNGLDRVKGYYQPTINMPGLDLTQLVEGVTYPNSTYYGNPFEPNQQYQLDTLLQDNAFNDNSQNVYDVVGDPFAFGYGPEELVGGVVSDNLNMIVATRPGTDWEATTYAHVGYNVVSIEIEPTSSSQTIYSFNNLVGSVAQLAVYEIDGTTNLGTRIYEPDFTIDWINSRIILANPISFSPIKNKIRIDVYETGNGNQLVKANTETDPIKYNQLSGWNEINVNCNYSAPAYLGSGVVVFNTAPIETEVTETIAITDSIVCDSVVGMLLNEPIIFQGTTFGNIIEDVTYYIKTIDTLLNRITISDVLIGGVAGPTFALTDATGSCFAVVNPGPGQVYATPNVYYNGEKLIWGITRTVTKTSSATNTVTCNNTTNMFAGEKIVFNQSIFGGVLQPNIIYNILSIVDINEFTIEDPLNPGNPLSLTSATGGATLLTNDFAFGIAENGVSAVIILPGKEDPLNPGTLIPYEQDVDYIYYTLFGETLPIQYGYTIPETQMITPTGNVTYSLTNFVGGTNPFNAVVELNGLRLIETTDYTIDPVLEEITFTTGYTVGNIISVTTFNDTQRQYFNTQYDIVNVSSNVVMQISSIENSINSPLAITTATATTAGTDEITVGSTSGFIVGQPIQFKGTSFGGVLTDGTVYFVNTIVDPTTVIVEDKDGNIPTLINDTGTMNVTVGGNPSVRITTSTNHDFTTNDIVRIDGCVGSTQLNNNIYYVHVISNTQFDIYTVAYDPSVTGLNIPVTDVNAYVGGGYVWINDTFTLVTTIITATTATVNEITANDTSNLVPLTPIIFTGTGFGNIVAGTTYYVREVLSSTVFTISDTQGGSIFVLTTDTGTMNATQWEQTNVDRLWVTVNGYRVPSSQLRLNPDNSLSILAEVNVNDSVTITSMMPSATPSEMVYFNFVNKNGQGSVYRANTNTRTWLTQDFLTTDETIYVHDVTRLTDTIVQNVFAPAPVSGVISIVLNGDKDFINEVTVYNDTLGYFVDAADYSVTIVNSEPVLEITGGVNTSDTLTITVILGNLIYINGEQIKFTEIDLVNNTLTGLQRGVNGTGVYGDYLEYTEVYSLLPTNRLPDLDYDVNWNSDVYNQELGDPLQISDTSSASFLRTDIT